MMKKMFLGFSSCGFASLKSHNDRYNIQAAQRLAARYAAVACPADAGPLSFGLCPSLHESKASLGSPFTSGNGLPPGVRWACPADAHLLSFGLCPWSFFQESKAS
jgi:hypothetical protein